MKRLTVPTTATQCAEVEREIIKVRDRKQRRGRDREQERERVLGSRAKSICWDQFSFAATNTVCGTVSAKNLFTLRCNCICFVVAYSQRKKKNLTNIRHTKRKTDKKFKIRIDKNLKEHSVRTYWRTWAAALVGAAVATVWQRRTRHVVQMPQLKLHQFALWILCNFLWVCMFACVSLSSLENLFRIFYRENWCLHFAPRSGPLMHCA